MVAWLRNFFWPRTNIMLTDRLRKLGCLIPLAQPFLLDFFLLKQQQLSRIQA